MRKFTVTWIIFFAVLAASAAFGGEDETKFQVDVRMVQLRATVTDSLGRHVRNLTKDDFRVYENGVEQRIRMVIPPAQSQTVPSSVFVLFDTSNRMYEDFPYAEDCVAGFIRELNPADSVAVYSFTRNVTRLAPITHDRFAAIGGLRKAVLGDATSLYDSLLLTLRDAAQLPGNKVVVVFSNGPDTSSMLSADNVRGVAEAEGIPIYVLSTRNSNAYANAAFRDLTANTGGSTYFATDWQRQILAFEAIGDDLKSSYLITYYPESADASYRKIDVHVAGDRAHSYRVRARTGYQPVRAGAIEKVAEK